MSDFLVIGGGALGLLTTREIASSDATVEVIDAGVAGREASWAGGGIISPLRPWEEAAAVLRLWRWSEARFPTAAGQLHDETGIDPQWSRCGLLYHLAGQDFGIAAQWYENNDVKIEKTAPESNAPAESISCPPGYSALFLPDIAHIRNPRLLRALRRSLDLSRNVSIRENAAARTLHVENDLVTHGVLENGEHIQAQRFIVTAGAWSPQFLDAIPPPIPTIEPVKGQMVAFAARPGLLPHMVYRDGRYLIPRMDGTILAGSTVEHAGFDKHPTPEALDVLRNFAIETLPVLRHVAVTHHWAGIRPGSPGGIPYIGPHPAIRNLYFNCGHFRNGLATSLASARLLADILLQRTPAMPAEPYALDAPRPTGP